MVCKIKKGVAAREIKGRYYVILPKEMKLVKLNKTGSFIFGLLSARVPEKLISQKLAARYKVSPACAGRDLAEFIRELKKAGVLS